MPGAPFLFFNETVAERAEIAGPHGMAQMPAETRHMPMMARAESMKA
jgi:hypothetical protein